MKILNKKEIDEFINKNNLEQNSTLCEYMKKYGSDKSSHWHNYSPLYDFIFHEIKKENINIFELGIYAGSSVRAWKEYFQKSTIFCGDVNSEYFIDEERIISFHCNQDDVNSIRDMWKNEKLKNLKFDIIIDDGKHEYSSNYNFLTNSFHKVKDFGYFIIEDLTNSTFSNFQSFLPSFIETYQPKFIELYKLYNGYNFIDNNLLIIQK